MRVLYFLATFVFLAAQSWAQEAILVGDAPLPGDINISKTDSSDFVGVWTCILTVSGLVAMIEMILLFTHLLR